MLAGSRQVLGPLLDYLVAEVTPLLLRVRTSASACANQSQRVCEPARVRTSANACANQRQCYSALTRLREAVA